MVIKIFSIYNIKVDRLEVMGELSSDSIYALGKNLEKALEKLGDMIPPTDEKSAIAKGAAYVGKFIAKYGTSFLLTKALGKAISELCYRQCKALLEGKEIPFDIENILKAPAFLKTLMDLYKVETELAATEEPPIKEQESK